MLAVINDHEEGLTRAGDGELRERALTVRRRAQGGEALDGLLPDCFALAREIERRITLVTLDRCWSDHLAEMQAVRDEVHLVQLGGQDPFVEYCRTAKAAFEALLARIDDTIVEIFERIEVTAEGVDWEREGLRGPSSTWTYLVNDNVFGNNTFLGLANRASFGLWAVLVCWWLLIPWALVLHWRRWREGKRGPEA